jgi:hypothetical protein
MFRAGRTLAAPQADGPSRLVQKKEMDKITPAWDFHDEQRSPVMGDKNPKKQPKKKQEKEKSTPAAPAKEAPKKK